MSIYCCRIIRNLIIKCHFHFRVVGGLLSSDLSFPAHCESSYHTDSAFVLVGVFGQARKTLKMLVMKVMTSLTMSLAKITLKMLMMKATMFLISCLVKTSLKMLMIKVAYDQDMFIP